MDAVRSEAIVSMLDMMRAHHSQMGSNTPFASEGSQAPSFAAAIRSAVDEVNATQLEARGLREAYERADGVPLTDVVIAMQKSSLAFEATLQVRNKVLKAYEDIMSMPV